MGDVSDETLMAFADGELSPAERALVEAVLARDPDLRKRLEIFEVTGRRISAAFSARLSEPLPQHLVDCVMNNTATSALELRPASAGATVWGRIVRSLSFEIPVWQTALASIAVLLVGIGTGSFVSRTSLTTAQPIVQPSVEPAVEQKMPLIALDKGHLVAAGRLAQVLETRPGYIIHELEDAGSDRPRVTARIRVTFKSQNGYCRQFEVTGNGDVLAAEIACRSEDGRWRVRAHATGGGGRSTKTGTMPVGEQGANIEAETIEATVGRLQIGDALGRDEEASAISRRWQP